MKQTNGNKLFTNMMSYAILQVINMFVGLFLPRMYLLVYDSEVNGIISTINSFTTYFSYLEAGLGLTLIHSLFAPLAKNETKEINGVLSYSQKQYKKISLIYFVLVVILSVVFPFIRVANDIGKVEFMLLVLVIGAYGALDFYSMAKYRVLLTADRKEYVLSNASIVAQIVRFLLVWGLLEINLYIKDFSEEGTAKLISVVVVKIIPILTLLVRSLILSIYVKRKYVSVDFNSPAACDISTTRSRFDALLLQISISTSTALPAIIVSQILGYKEANVYAVYALVTSSIISIVSALSSGVSPMLGKSIARGEDIKNTYSMYNLIVSAVITVAFSVTAVMFIPFIELYTNGVEDINYIYPSIALLISVWAALYSYRIPITAVVNAAAVYKENRLNNIVNMVIQLVGGVIATVIMGIPGLLVVMIISALQRNVWLAFNNSRKLLHNSVLKCIVSQTLMSALVILFYLIGNRLVENIEFSTARWVIVALIVSVAASFLVVCVFALSDVKTSKEIWKLVCRKIHKKA